MHQHLDIVMYINLVLE